MKAVHTPALASDDSVWDGKTEARQGQFDVITEPSGQRRFWFVCPGPCKSLSAIALRPVVDGSSQSWEFDGNLAAPTLSPSINHGGCWHGWLQAGEFRSC
jgi:hypothetical protein